MNHPNYTAALAHYWDTHPEWRDEATAAGHSLDTLPVQAALFDMDGVLFDSMPGHAKAWAQVCHEAGLDISPEEIYLNEGRTAFSTLSLFTRRTWNRDTNAEEVERFYARKCELFNSYPEAPQMPGAFHLLEQVVADRLTTVVVTGSGQASLLDRLMQNYPGVFDPTRIVSSRDVQHGKPHPEPYLMGLAKAGQLRPWQTFVVENAPLGVRAAVSAGIFTIAVNTGPLDPTVLADEGAALVFPSMTALAEAWPELRSTFGLR